MFQFPYQKQLQRFWDRLIVPPPFIQEPIKRHRAQFLNTMLISFIPIALFLFFFQKITDPRFDLSTDTSPKAITLGIAVVLLIYLVNRTTRYWLANYVALAIGLLIILVTAIASDPPHTEITFLIVLPLAGIMLLSVTENIIMCLATIAALLIFYRVMGDIPRDMLTDEITIFTVLELMIVFASHQRNQLEIDRQRQMVENEKIRILAQFIQDVSHEFRTPLSIMNTGLYLIGKTTDPEAQQRRAAAIQNQITYLARLIDDMTTMTRLDSRTAPTFSTVNMDRLMQETVTAVRSQAEARGLHLEVNLPSDLPMIQGDMDELQLAFAHLLRNAVQYTAQGGVQVRAFQQQNSIVIEIEDTGIGIPETVQEQIFERFYRVDQARSTSGAGLGLSIARKIIRDHHGQIAVESSPDAGSLFRVTLPVALK